MQSRSWLAGPSSPTGPKKSSPSTKSAATDLLFEAALSHQPPELGLSRGELAKKLREHAIGSPSLGCRECQSALLIVGQVDW